MLKGRCLSTSRHPAAYRAHGRRVGRPSRRRRRARRGRRSPRRCRQRRAAPGIGAVANPAVVRVASPRARGRHDVGRSSAAARRSDRWSGLRPRGRACRVPVWSDRPWGPMRRRRTVVGPPPVAGVVADRGLLASWHKRSDPLERSAPRRGRSVGRGSGGDVDDADEIASRAAWSGPVKRSAAGARASASTRVSSIAPGAGGRGSVAA